MPFQFFALIGAWYVNRNKILFTKANIILSIVNSVMLLSIYATFMLKNQELFFLASAFYTVLEVVLIVSRGTGTSSELQNE